MPLKWKIGYHHGQFHFIDCYNEVFIGIASKPFSKILQQGYFLLTAPCTNSIKSAQLLLDVPFSCKMHISNKVAITILIDVEFTVKEEQVAGGINAELIGLKYC